MKVVEVDGWEGGGGWTAVVADMVAGVWEADTEAAVEGVEEDLPADKENRLRCGQKYN